MHVALSALMAMQEPHEVYLAEYFQDVNLSAIHAGQVTKKTNISHL
jgi:histone H3/H4